MHTSSFAAWSMRRGRRRGVAVLELIVVLPILLICLLMLVQVGQFFLNFQQVALAGRVGAEEASQTAGLASLSAVPPDVVAAIEHQLHSSGLQQCRIRLEHNIGGPHTVLYEPVSGGCDCTPDASLPAPPPGEYVRLTVSVPLAELMPDYLSLLGGMVFGADSTADSTSTFHYEL